MWLVQAGKLVMFQATDLNFIFTKKLMDILLVAATPDEIAPTIVYLNQKFKQIHPGIYQNGAYSVAVLITGVGMVVTAWEMGRYLTLNKPDWVINAGIAGALDPALQLGQVVQVASDCFADLGAETADNQFLDLFDLQLCGPNDPPFIDGHLYNSAAEQATFLPRVQGLTVNRTHGSAETIRALRIKYPGAQVETMEGAAFFYACLQTGVLFLPIRSISNYVEPRNRKNWKIRLAVEQLNLVVIEMLESLAILPIQ